MGLTYRSPVHFRCKDRIRFNNLGPGLRRALDARIRNGTSLDQTLPQAVILIWYRQLTKKSALMGNFGWQNWEQYGDVDITIRSNTAGGFTSDAHFGDTWHGAIVARFRLSKPLLFWAGFAYDSSAVSKFHRTPAMPFDRAFRYGLGLEYGWSEDVTVGVAYEFPMLGAQRRKAGSRLTGTVRGITDELHPLRCHEYGKEIIRNFAPGASPLRQGGTVECRTERYIRTPEDDNRVNSPDK